MNDPDKSAPTEERDVPLSAGRMVDLSALTSTTPRSSRRARQARPMAPRLAQVPLQQAPSALVLVGVGFFAVWLAGAICGLLLGHFSPQVEDQAQFITLLLGTLVAFSAAILAGIELAKQTRGGRSVGLSLAWVVVLLNVILGFYAGHWLFVGAYLLFALTTSYLLSRSTRPRVLAIGALGIVLALAVMVGPTAWFLGMEAQVRGESQTCVDAVLAHTPSPDDSAATLVPNGTAQQATRLLPTVTWWQRLHRVLGLPESETRDAVSRHALMLAFSGRVAEGFARVRQPEAWGEGTQLFTTKAWIFSLREGFKFEPYRFHELTDEQKFQAEFPFFDEMRRESQEATQARTGGPVDSNGGQPW